MQRTDTNQRDLSADSSTGIGSAIDPTPMPATAPLVMGPCRHLHEVPRSRTTGLACGELIYLGQMERCHRTGTTTHVYLKFS